MDEQRVTEQIINAIYDGEGISTVRNFENAGVMTRDNGLVIRYEDGTEFQITVIQSR